jgi:hypothetical protein
METNDNLVHRPKTSSQKAISTFLAKASRDLELGGAKIRYPWKAVTFVVCRFGSMLGIKRRLRMYLVLVVLRLWDEKEKGYRPER